MLHKAAVLLITALISISLTGCKKYNSTGQPPTQETNTSTQSTSADRFDQPLAAAFAASVILACVFWRKHILLLAGVAFFTLQQILIGQGGYVLAPYGIFVALLVALGVQAAMTRLPSSRYAFLFLAFYLGFFVANSHVTGRHYGPTGVLKSLASSENFGVYQLDRFLDELVVRDTEIGDTFDIYHRIKSKDDRLKQYLVPQAKSE